MNETGNIFYDELMLKLLNMEEVLIDVRNGNGRDDAIDVVFREMHTIKGSADLLGMFDVVSITHKAENLLVEIRDNTVEFSLEICDLLIELKKLLVVLIDNLLNGVDLNKEVMDLVHKFEEHLLLCMPTAKKIKTILIVDESFVIREQIKKIAQDRGYIAITATTDVDGMLKFENKTIDLVISEIESPLTNGINMLKDIRYQSKNEQVPMVILVSKDNKDFKQTGKELLAKAWLFKPLNKDQLLVIFDNILEK